MKAKILFLTRLFHPHAGGVEKHVLRVSRELIKEGYQITIITEQFEESLPLQDSYQDITIIRIPHHRCGKKVGTWSWMTQHMHFFLAADVVHVHDVGWWIFPIAPFIFTKLFVTFHGWEGACPPSSKSMMQRKIITFLARKTIHIGQFIEKWYKVRPDLMLYGGVGRISQIKKPIFSRKAKKVAFIGRLDKANDIDKVIEFMKLVKIKHPQIECTFVGDGEARGQCEQVGNVTGWQSSVEPFVNSADIVIANSYLAILESLAAGKMVVSIYNNPLKKDYLELFPLSEAIIIAESAPALAEKIEESLKHPEHIQKKIEKAHTWLQHNTWKKIADHYVALWNS